MSKFRTSAAPYFRLCIFVLLFTLVGCGEADNLKPVDVVRPVRTIEVVDLSKLHERFFVGSARAAREVSLAFRIPGTVVGIAVKIGDEVKQGDTVASLDPAPYQAKVDRLSADLESAIATHENAKAQTERQLTLLAKDVVAQALVDRYVAGEKSAAAAIKSVQGALDKATLDLGYTQLPAPFNGVVVARYVEEFEEVAAQRDILRVLDSDDIEMVINVPERIISMVPHVEDIRVTFDAIGDIEIPARISEIGTEASATTRTYPVTLLMSQPNGARILPGMTGRARARPKKGYEQFSDIMVPAAAVFVPEGQDQPHVWIVERESMIVEPRPVKLGQPRSRGLSIESGVKIGDIVVTAGANSLRDGQKVTLLDKEDRE